MKVEVLGYRNDHQLPEFVEPEQVREIEVPDDSHAVIVRRGVFMYGGEMPSWQPEDGFILPETLEFRSLPIDHESHESCTQFGACDLVTVTYLVVAKEPFELTRTLAACDENWGSDHPTEIEEKVASKPIKEVICAWTAAKGQQLLQGAVEAKGNIWAPED
ncbi:MAG TPA: hypothetical protein VF974_08605 [Patescibacteria group bacterium]